jgi:hypothetical protein
MKVQVHLLDDAVEVGRHGYFVPEGAVNPVKLLTEFMDCGLQVFACGVSLTDRQIYRAAMIEGIEM